MAFPANDNFRFSLIEFVPLLFHRPLLRRKKTDETEVPDDFRFIYWASAKFV